MKIYVHTKKQNVIIVDVNFTKVENKFGVKPGTLCCDKNDNNYRVVGLYKNYLCFIGPFDEILSPAKGRSSVIFWITIKDYHTLVNTLTVYPNFIMPKEELLKILPQVPEEELNQISENIRLVTQPNFFNKYSKFTRLSDDELEDLVIESKISEDTFNAICYLKMQNERKKLRDKQICKLANDIFEWAQNDFINSAPKI